MRWVNSLPEHGRVDNAAGAERFLERWVGWPLIVKTHEAAGDGHVPASRWPTAPPTSSHGGEAARSWPRPWCPSRVKWRLLLARTLGRGCLLACRPTVQVGGVCAEVTAPRPYPT